MKNLRDIFYRKINIRILLPTTTFLPLKSASFHVGPCIFNEILISSCILYLNSFVIRNKQFLVHTVFSQYVSPQLSAFNLSDT